MHDDERDRLLRAVYSREAEAEPLEERVDPSTGETVRMRASEWALAQYDREAAVVAASAVAAAAEEAGAPEADEEAPAVAAVPASDPDAIARLRRPGIRAVIASATVLACLAAGWAIGASTYAGPDVSPVAAEPSSPAAVIHGIFVGDSLPAVDPGPAVTDGYTPQSFRLVAGEVAAADTRIYAAIRADGQFCLVVGVHGARAVAACGTSAEIGSSGLRLSLDGTSAGDGRTVTVTVEWRTSGLITWDAQPVATT
jgi:hypothetical protein